MLKSFREGGESRLYLNVCVTNKYYILKEVRINAAYSQVVQNYETYAEVQQLQ